MKYVIIGAGVAGLTAAETIKKYETAAEVVLIGDERFFPYKRYLLTEFLNDTVDEEQIVNTSTDYFNEKGITLRKGEVVKAVHPKDNTIKFFHNEVLSYDKLLIATGGRPMLGPTLKPFKKNIQTYYSLDDIFLLKKKLSGKNSCLVYGQGLSALDLMRGLRNLGKKVFYMTKKEKANFPLITSQFDQDINDFLADKGVELILNDFIVGIAKKNNSFQVQTLNKKEINVDIVFAWETYEPNLEVIAGTAIEKKTGILVDLQLRTTEKDIYAAGDCVEIYHPELKDYWINFGWPNAEKQGELAGKNMTGQSQEYQIQQTIPFNLFGKSLKARWWA